MTETSLIHSKVELAKPIATPGSIESLFEQYRRSFEIAAPQHLDVNRVMRVALMTASRSQHLLECTAGSLLAAFMLSVQLGLDIGAKECHLVPFRNKSGTKEVQLVPDYRGLLKLIRNSGQVCGSRARNVYKQDHFELEEGTHPVLRHIPNFQVERRFDDIIGAYSIADFCNEQRMPTGYSDTHFIPRSHILRVRDKSPAKDSGPWVEFFDEMALKTVIKHHSKTLPYSIALATAVELDNRVEMVKPQEIALIQSPGGLLSAEVIPPSSEENGEHERKQDVEVISESQAKRAFAIGKGKGFTIDQYRAVIKRHGFDSDKDIPKNPKTVYDNIVAELEKGPRNDAAA